jgi:hypothetical protein
MQVAGNRTRKGNLIDSVLCLLGYGTRCEQHWNAVQNGIAAPAGGALDGILRLILLKGKSLAADRADEPVEVCRMERV